MRLKCALNLFIYADYNYYPSIYLSVGVIRLTIAQEYATHTHMDFDCQRTIIKQHEYTIRRCIPTHFMFAVSCTKQMFQIEILLLQKDFVENTEMSRLLTNLFKISKGTMENSIIARFFESI